LKGRLPQPFVDLSRHRSPPTTFFTVLKTTAKTTAFRFTKLEPTPPQHLTANHWTPCINADEQSRLTAEFFSKVTRFICESSARTKYKKPLDPDNVTSRSNHTSATYTIRKSFNCYTAEAEPRTPNPEP
jgi:hypothetical protein